MGLRLTRSELKIEKIICPDARLDLDKLHFSNRVMLSSRDEVCIRVDWDIWSSLIITGKHHERLDSFRAGVDHVEMMGYLSLGAHQMRGKDNAAF